MSISENSQQTSENNNPTNRKKYEKEILSYLKIRAFIYFVLLRMRGADMHTEKNFNIKQDQLLIHFPKSESICKIFSSNYETEKDIGKLFGLVEFEIPKTQENLKVLENFISEILTLYFDLANNELAKIKSKNLENTSIDAEKIFENTLQKINLKGSELKVKLPKLQYPRKINAAIALLFKNHLYLAHSGTIGTFLIYPEKTDYKIINILENTNVSLSEEKETTLFSNIINGPIEAENFLLFCTENLFNYFSLEKLKRVAIENSIHTLSNELHSLFDQEEKNRAFAALILKLQEYSEEKEPLKENLPQISLEEFLATQSATEKLLTPSLQLNIKNNIKKFSNHFQILKFKKFFTFLTFLIKLLIFTPIKILFSLFKFIFQFFSQFILLLFYSVTHQKEKQNKILIELKQTLFQPSSKLILWFKALPRPSKILFIAFIIFIFLFSQSVILLYRKQKNEIEIEAYNATISAIEEKKNTAESSIIYGDEEKAKKLLEEAKKMIAELPTNNRHRKETQLNLTNEIQALLEKLQHIVNISDPTLIADLNKPETNTLGFVMQDRYLYVYDSKNTVNKINLENNEIVQTINLTLSENNQLKFGIPKDRNSILFYHSNGLYEFDLENKIGKTVEITIEPNAEIKDIDIYNQKIYLLDTKNNQIFKHSKTLTGYSRGSAWIKDGTDVTNGVGMTIDGAIYLVKSNGELLRFMYGSKDDFKTTIDPPLAHPIKIWTENNSNFIYILEPKRLVVINKDGKLIVQYRGEKFDNLKDFAVLEKEKKIYFLNENKIYGIAAIHL